MDQCSVTYRQTAFAFFLFFFVFCFFFSFFVSLTIHLRQRQKRFSKHRECSLNVYDKSNYYQNFHCLYCLLCNVKGCDVDSSNSKTTSSSIQSLAILMILFVAEKSSVTLFLFVTKFQMTKPSSRRSIEFNNNFFDPNLISLTFF